MTTQEAPTTTPVLQAKGLVKRYGNVTALNGADFAATNGLLVIPAGQTNASFIVPVFNDTLDELSETIALNQKETGDG